MGTIWDPCGRAGILIPVEPELKLLSPWTTPYLGDGLVLELQREVGPDHPLFSKPTRALAVARDRDDVLFEISEGSTRTYAVVHLTWSRKQEASGKFPLTLFLTRSISGSNG
jgi:hypothetical protein